MFRTLTVLIVMTLAGSPAVKLVCDVWCQAKAHSSDAAAATCHDTHDPGGQTIRAAADGCASSIVVAPFVTEAAFKTLPPAAGCAASFVACAPLLDLQHADGATLLRGDSGPPRGSTITVLRI